MNRSLSYPILIATLFLIASCGKEASTREDGAVNVAFVTSEIVSVTESDTRTGDVPGAIASDPVPFVSDLPLDEPLFLFTTEEDGVTVNGGDNDAVNTRGAQVGSVSSSFTFGVSEFATSGGAAVSSFQNVKPTYESISGTTAVFNSGKRWEAGAYTGSQYAFHAYSPYLSATTNGLTLNSGNKTITYDMSSLSAANQPDLMTAYASTTYVATVPLAFSHRLCAIRIVLGSNWRSGFSVTSVKFKSIYKQGTVTIQNGTWSVSGFTKGDYTVSGINTPTAAGGVVIGETSKYLMMVPQTLSGASLEIVLKDSSNKSYTLSASITGTWTAGKTVTYTLNPTGITSMTVTYPQWTLSGGSTTISGPVSDYTTSDSFGLYAVNSSGTAVFSNRQISVSSVNTSTHVATLSLPANEFWSKNWTYYIYYPYKASPGDVTATATTADIFFATVISNWSVATTQNNIALYKAQDLHVGKLSGTSFSMAHKMGLARMNIANKTAPATKTITTYLNGTQVATTTTNSSNNVTLTTSTILESGTANRLYKDSNNYYWTIVKPSTSVNLSSQSGNDAWTFSVSGISGGQYKTYTAQSARECKNYSLKYDFTNSVRELTVPLSGTYEFHVWGAQGYGFTYNGTNYIGGYGGYSYGRMSLTKGAKIYVIVGETGGGGWGSTNNYAFPNGGGNGGSSGSHVGTGGGASLITNTSVTINSRTSLKDNLADTNIYILAGGGGAAAYGQETTPWTGHGGAAGGYHGYAGTDNSKYTGGEGGTQSAGGAAGGVSGRPAGEKLAGGGIAGITCTGGGGGYYGGGSSWGSAGGGGSGYIGHSSLTNKKMVGYFKSGSGLTSDTAAYTSNTTSIKTEATTNVSSTPTADYAKTGNGYIIINSLL